MTFEELKLCFLTVCLEMRKTAKDRCSKQIDPRCYTGKMPLFSTLSRNIHRFEMSAPWGDIACAVGLMPARTQSMEVLIHGSLGYVDKVLLDLTELSAYFEGHWEALMARGQLSKSYIEALLAFHDGICKRAALLFLGAMQEDEGYEQVFGDIEHPRRDLFRFQAALVRFVDQPCRYAEAGERLLASLVMCDPEARLDDRTISNLTTFLTRFRFPAAIQRAAVYQLIHEFMLDSRYQNCFSIIMEHLPEKAKPVLDERLQEENRIICEALREELLKRGIQVPEPTGDLRSDIALLLTRTPLRKLVVADDSRRRPLLQADASNRHGRRAMVAARWQNSTISVLRERLRVQHIADGSDVMVMDAMFGLLTTTEVKCTRGLKDGRRSELESLAAAYQSVLGSLSEEEKKLYELTNMIFNVVQYFSMAEGDLDNLLALQIEIGKDDFQWAEEKSPLLIIASFIQHISCSFSALREMDQLLDLLEARMKAEEDEAKEGDDIYYGRFVARLLPLRQQLQDDLRELVVEFVCTLPAEVLVELMRSWQAFAAAPLPRPG